MKSERHGLRTGSGEVHALKSGERADRRAVNTRMREIKFDNFVACNGAGVRNAHRSRDGRASADLVWSNLRVGVVESRKAQTVAKRIERLLGEIAIGAAVHAVAAERWKLGDGFIESDGQSAGGIVIAGKDVGDSGAAFFARIPGLEDRGRVLLSPVDSNSAAGGENDDERFTGRSERFEKLLLRFGEIEVQAVAAEKAGITVFGFLSFKLCGEANYCNDDIGFARGVHGFLDQVGR